MTWQVLIAHAEDEQSRAEEIAGPLRNAGYEVAHRGTVMVGESVVEEASKLLSLGGPIVVCATIKAIGTGWAHRIVNVSRLHPSAHVFVVQMEKDAYVEQLAWGSIIAMYWLDPNKTIQDLIKSLNKYYPIQSIPLETLDHDMEPLSFVDKLTNYSTFDQETLSEFRKQIRPEIASIYTSLSPVEFLTEANLMRKGFLTRAGVLLFGDNPTGNMPSAIVQCMFVAGHTLSAPRERKVITKAIPQQIIQTHKFISDHIRQFETPRAESSDTKILYEYPMICVREIIANALAHRDFEDGARVVHVRVYDDRIEIHNPGTWIAKKLEDNVPIALDSLETHSIKRNLRLATVLSWVRLVEGEGSGIPTAINDCRKLGAPIPQVVQEDGFVKVTIFPVSDWDMMKGTVTTNVSSEVSRFLVPFPRNPYFVGRDEDLATLHAMLQGSKSLVGIRPTVLVGLGGIGKTQLAVEYAHAYRVDYPGGIFWLNATNPLLYEFAKMAELLELADADTPRDMAAQRCYEYLNQHLDTLVIFDNVEEPKNLNVPFARGLIPANLRCRMLFTTRMRDFPTPFQAFEVKTLPQVAAMHLLLQHPSRRPIQNPNHPDHGLARDICITLGYLPLALALAGAFLADYPDISLYDYRARLLNEGAIEVIDSTPLRLEDMPTRHETAVRATLKASWDGLNDKDARLALQALGQMREAELIPILRLGLLTGLVSNTQPGHPAPLTQALKKLYAASLIEELNEDRLRLNPLVHAFAARLSPSTFRAEMAERVATMFNNLSALQSNVVQRGIEQVLEDLQIALELCPHKTQDDHVFNLLIQLEQVLSLEAPLLSDWDVNAKNQSDFFLQQFRNCALQLGYSDLQSRAEDQLGKPPLSG